MDKFQKALCSPSNMELRINKLMAMKDRFLADKASDLADKDIPDPFMFRDELEQLDGIFLEYAKVIRDLLAMCYKGVEK